MTADEPVGGVGQRFARPVYARRVRRDEPEAAPQRGRRGDDGSAGGDDSGSQQRASREWTHGRTSASPVIIARRRDMKPARTNIARWTNRKRVSAIETTKCSVRADCFPPRSVTVDGQIAVKPGDIARPVQMTAGTSTKI